jgi:hypothetical protein
MVIGLFSPTLLVPRGFAAAHDQSFQRELLQIIHPRLVRPVELGRSPVSNQVIFYHPRRYAAFWRYRHGDAVSNAQ